ncbi:MAG TPA: choice-of-anchor K domain-containing protein [Terrimicrobiaceae bacterium]
MNRVKGLRQSRPPGGSKAKRPIKTLRNRVVKAVGLPVAILAGAVFGGSVAFGDTSDKISFDGASSGVLISPTGASNLLTTGVGTNSFSWGLGVNSPPSSLTFTGASVDGAFAEQPFTIGTLSYFNGTVLGGTEAYSVGLRTSLTFSGFTQQFDYGFQLLNTSETGDPVRSADSVFLSSSLPTSRFTIDGVSYTLKLAFGSVTGGGFSEISQFFVLEGGSASADLIGSITTETPTNPTQPPVTGGGAGGPGPTVVPEPSTVVGGISAGGLILAFLVRRLRRGGSQTVLA